MKLNFKNRISLILFISIIIFIAILKLYPVYLLDVRPFYKIDISVIRLCIASGFAILVILIIEKKHDFFSLFNLMWVFPLSLLLSFFLIKNYNVEKLDYLFSQKVKNFEIVKYKEGGWIVNRFVVEGDTIYFSQNPSWGDVYNGKYKIYRSIFQKHYHLTKKDE